MSGAHENLRLRVLLAWAVEFVERNTNAFEECHINPQTDEVDDEEVAAEIADARRWLAEAEEMGIEATNG